MPTIRFKFDINIIHDNKSFINLLCTVLFGFLLCLSIHSTAIAQEDNSSLDNNSYRFESLKKQIRCIYCANQSIDDSLSPFALELKVKLAAAIALGKTDKQIISDLKEQYGEKIVYNPSFNNNTLILWFAPIVFALLIAFLSFLMVRRGRRS